MREFKFRAWDFKKMNYDPSISDGTDGGATSWVMINHASPDDGSILMECTGLQDKYGLDIYEGDIIEYKNELGRHNIHKVYYESGGLVINSHTDDLYKDEWTPFYEACADAQTKQYIKQCMVIGNIYENKELLKK
jgi:uncharacterized phage protein (TIGR01671 family)